MGRRAASQLAGRLARCLQAPTAAIALPGCQSGAGVAAAAGRSCEQVQEHPGRGQEVRNAGLGADMHRPAHRSWPPEQAVGAARRALHAARARPVSGDPAERESVWDMRSRALCLVWTCAPRYLMA